LSSTLFRARALRKRFGAVTALDGIDLELARGETIAIVGPNGAGKSTLLRVVAGLARPSSGECEPCVEREWRSAIGYLGHQTWLYPELTARENLIFAGRLHGIADPDSRADRLLEEERLTPAAHRRADGFSRGMAQRLSIARARVHDPDILLLDEPYTGLDRRAAERLTERLADLKAAGHTLLLVTHDIAQAGRLADAMLLLVAGRVRARWCGSELDPETLEQRYLALVEENAA
jgi:ABC-type multidrug transport system ATPase subunit